MRAIPKSVLCHSAVLNVKFLHEDKWNKTNGSASSPLENVRFEPVYRNERNVSQNGAVITGRVFVDAVNSSCGIPLMNVGDIYQGQKITAQTISFNGREYNVEEVKTFCDDVKIHHWEVLLSG